MCARRIILYSTNRAEYGLVKPIREALGPPLDVDPFFTMFDAMENVSVKTGWGFAEWTINEFKRPDIALVPCDRQEMVGVALYLFYHNIPFAQLHAGDTGSGTHDEIGRWIISRCANLHFCNSPESAQNLAKSGEESWRIHLVGSTAFDSVEIDESLCPKTSPKLPFSLVLIHPDTYSPQATLEDLGQTKSKLTIFSGPPCPQYAPQYVIIGPNKDKHHDLIEETWDFYAKHYPNQVSYYRDGVPRPKFLGLMKNCIEFITNSSSALYELPYFDINKYVPIGRRNADRKPLGKIEPGGAKRIAEILASVEINDRLLRKKFLV